MLSRTSKRPRIATRCVKLGPPRCTTDNPMKMTETDTSVKCKSIADSVGTPPASTMPAEKREKNESATQRTQSEPTGCYSSCCSLSGAPEAVSGMVSAANAICTGDDAVTDPCA